MRENVRSAIKETDRNIARTVMLGKELREAGQTVVNNLPVYIRKNCRFKINNLYVRFEPAINYCMRMNSILSSSSAVCCMPWL